MSSARPQHPLPAVSTMLTPAERMRVDAAGEGWDLVVSNPPYVDSLEGLQPELAFEPAHALLGVGFHERIARTARTAALVLEVGAGQAREVAASLGRAGYRDVTVTRDLAGIERVVDGRR